jgi:hypothetical protein
VNSVSGTPINFSTNSLSGVNPDLFAGLTPNHTQALIWNVGSPTTNGEMNFSFSVINLGVGPESVFNITLTETATTFPNPGLLYGNAQYTQNGGTDTEVLSATASFSGSSFTYANNVVNTSGPGSFQTFSGSTIFNNLGGPTTFSQSFQLRVGDSENIQITAGVLDTSAVPAPPTFALALLGAPCIGLVRRIFRR